MHMRLVQSEVKSGTLPRLREVYARRIIPALQDVAGCRYAGLMQSVHHPDQCISLTLWNSREDAQAYETSGMFQGLMEEVRPFLSESSEFRIQLSENLTLECVPVPSEPTVKAYPVAAGDDLPMSRLASGDPILLRIVSLKVLPGKLDEFNHLYKVNAVPALRKTTGCRYVYLLESDQRAGEVLSVTSWDSTQDAEAYEQSGLFEQLLESQRQTLSGLYQWKRSLGKEQAVRSATSEDVLVEHYDVLIEKNFG